LNRAFWGSKNKTRNGLHGISIRVFINPAVPSNLFLHDLTIAYRKPREIVKIVRLVEKRKGSLFSEQTRLFKE
jgi:hypothetical protein